MMEVILWCKLKNTDLSCLSAKEAIEDMMGYTDLLSLNRLTQWKLISDQPIPPEKIETILKESFYLANPNKTFVYPNHIPGHPTVTGQYVAVRIWDVGLSEHQLTGTINQRFQTQITSIRQSTVWEMGISPHIQNPAEWALDRIVSTRSYRHGLLMHPLYQQYEWIEAKDIYATPI